MSRETTIGNPLRLALIGMSGSGKTFWAKKLAEKGARAIFGGDGAGAPTADRKIFERPEAGAVARRVSAEERRDPARDRRAVLPGADGGAAAELRSAGALHGASGGIARWNYGCRWLSENDS